MNCNIVTDIAFIFAYNSEFKYECSKVSNYVSKFNEH